MDMYQKRKMRKNKKMDENPKSLPSTSINWYPGHMAKTKRLIKEMIASIDVVFEVIDSRVPKSSHIIDLNEFIGNKKIVIIFNKYDLCDKKTTDKYIKIYNDLGYDVIKCDSKNGNDYMKVITYVKNYMKNINEKRKEKGLLPKKAKCLVVGAPNCGKSTLINKIVNKKISQTGNKPGVTKEIITIRINSDMDLVDSPGLLWPKLESENDALNLACMSIIKEEIVSTDKMALHILNKLYNNYKDLYIKYFGIDYFSLDNLEEIYEIISKKLGIPIRNGEVDYDRINTYILNMIKGEKIKNITFE